MRDRVAIAVALIEILITSRVDASTIVVTRSAPASDCPDASALARSIRTMTPKAPTAAATEDDAPDRVSVSFDRDRDGYRVRIETRGENAGSRDLSDPNTSCASLAQATALTIALILDPNATPPPPPPPPAPPPPPKEEAAREEPTRPWGFSAFVAGGGALGIVRGAAPYGSLGLTIAPTPLFAMNLSGVLLPTQSLPLSPGAVDVALTGGTAEVCLVPFGSHLRFGACGGVLVAALSAVGKGYASDSAARRPLVGGTLGLVAEGSLVGLLGWVAHVDGFAPIHRESFGISGAGVAYEEPPIGGLLSLGASVKFR